MVKAINKGTGKSTRDKAKSIEYWRDVISQYKASGLSHRQFCAENGLGFSAFKNWFYRIRAMDESLDVAPSPLFTPIIVEEPASPLSAQESHEPPLILELSDMRIVVASGFGEETLRRLIHVIRGEHV